MKELDSIYLQGRVISLHDTRLLLEISPEQRRLVGSTLFSTRVPVLVLSAQNSHATLEPILENQTDLENLILSLVGNVITLACQFNKDGILCCKLSDLKAQKGGLISVPPPDSQHRVEDLVDEDQWE